MLPLLRESSDPPGPRAKDPPLARVLTAAIRTGIVIPNAAMRTLVRYSRAAPVGTPGGSMLTAASAEGGVRG
jgi:hypothetical protein